MGKELFGSTVNQSGAFRNTAPDDEEEWDDEDRLSSINLLRNELAE